MIVHLSHLRYLTSQTPSEHKRQKANKKELSRRLLLRKIRSELLCIVACPVLSTQEATTQEKVVVHLPMIIYQLLTFTSNNKEEKKKERKELNNNNKV